MLTQPIGMDEAARLLAISRRTLTELIKKHPYYSSIGRRNSFYPDDLRKLRAAIRRETGTTIPIAARGETIRIRMGGLRKYYAEHYGRHLAKAKELREVIYFVRVGDKVKIGFACDLQRRLPELQSGCPEPYTILGVMAGSRELELDLHNQFMEHHYRGEWFILTEELSAFIAENCVL